MSDVDSEYKTVDVSEKGHGNTYIVHVLLEDDSVLIGEPIKNQNKRIRVEKDSGVVRFVSDSDDIDDLRTANLRSIRDNVPGWVEQYS